MSGPTALESSPTPAETPTAPGETLALPEEISEQSRIAESFSAFLHDESKLQAKSILSIVLPKTSEEVAGVLRHHAPLKTPITVSGARTGVVGGAVPSEQSLVLSLDKLTGIEAAYQHAASGEYRVRVKAGTRLYQLQEYLIEELPEYFLPLDPTETWASLGGMVATNASGARAYHYGSTRDWVRWIRVVLASGAVLELTRGSIIAQAGKLKIRIDGEEKTLAVNSIPKPKTKHTIGYHFSESVDAIDLFIGSEGTLGVVTDIEFALEKVPPHRLFLLQFFDSADRAFAFVRKLREDSRLELLAIEYCDAHSLDLIRSSPIRESCRPAQMLTSDIRGAVIAEIIYAEEEALEELFIVLDELVSAAGGSLEQSVAGVEERDLKDIRIFRHAIPERVNALIAERKTKHSGLHKLGTDMAVPDSALEEIFQYYQDVLNEHGLEYAIFGHAGNNHFHVNVIPKDEEELKLAKGLYKHIAEKVVQLGGAVSAEHGIGRLKKEFLALQYDSAALDVMREIKHFFDPEWRLNSGVLFDKNR